MGNRTDGTHVEPRSAGGQCLATRRNPTVVHQIGPPLEGNPGESSRELRIWPQQNLLLVLNHGCSELIHRCAGGNTVRSTIHFYDISGANAAHPELVSTFLPSRTRAQVPHEFFLWADPARPGRALLYYTNPSPDRPGRADRDRHLRGRARAASRRSRSSRSSCPSNGLDNRLHSLGISDDGTRGYLAYLGGGFMVVDTSDFAAGLSAARRCG